MSLEDSPRSHPLHQIQIPTEVVIFPGDWVKLQNLPPEQVPPDTLAFYLGQGDRGQVYVVLPQVGEVIVPSEEHVLPAKISGNKTRNLSNQLGQTVTTNQVLPEHLDEFVHLLFPDDSV